MRRICPALLFIGSTAFAQNWTQLPDFPGNARDDAASFTIGNRIYVGTGMDAGFQLTNDWWCFDTQTETWTAIASIPATPRQYCTGFTISDTGYVFGGVDANGALDELWAYQPQSAAWEQKASMPAEARYACVAVTGYYANALVTTGMLASGAPTNEAWKYHADADAWEPIAPVPGPARHRAACFLDSGGMLIAGGADSAFNALSDVWSYPIWFETGEWYPRTPLPFPRFAADGGWGTSQVLVGGASGSTADMVHASAWRYDLNAWPSLPDFPGGPRRGGVAATGAETQWTSTVYYGTGSDNMIRYRDWWKLEFPVIIAERTTGAFSLFPVPANSSLNIRMRERSDWQSWRLSGPDGTLLMQGSVRSANIELPAAGLASGTYLIRLSGIHGTATQRFTVVH